MHTEVPEDPLHDWDLEAAADADADADADTGADADAEGDDDAAKLLRLMAERAKRGQAMYEERRKAEGFVKGNVNVASAHDLGLPQLVDERDVLLDERDVLLVENQNYVLRERQLIAFIDQHITMLPEDLKATVLASQQAQERHAKRVATKAAAVVVVPAAAVAEASD